MNGPQVIIITTFVACAAAAIYIVGKEHGHREGVRVEARFRDDQELHARMRELEGRAAGRAVKPKRRRGKQ